MNLTIAMRVSYFHLLAVGIVAAACGCSTSAPATAVAMNQSACVSHDDCRGDRVCDTETGECVLPDELPEAPPEGEEPDAAPPANPEQAPKILSFGASTRSLTQGQKVRFTLVATDPQGIDDLIGGSLHDPSSGDTYGAFATSAAEGSYSLELTWQDMHQTRAIDFIGSASREFEARMYDVAGNMASKRVSLSLTCPAGGACSGICQDLSTDTRCGSCSNACGAKASCSTRLTCECDEGARACGTSCVDEPLHSLTYCGAACKPCGADQWCDGTSCKNPSDGDVRQAKDGVMEIYHGGLWKGICATFFWGSDAEVLCRQMRRGAFENSYGRYARDIGDFWVYRPGCTGTESRLTECPEFEWMSGPSTACGWDDYVGSIACGQ